MDDATAFALASEIEWVHAADRASMIKATRSHRPTAAEQYDAHAATELAFLILRRANRTPRTETSGNE